MNTYFQDETIPIYITLSYINELATAKGALATGNMIKFPINPETLEKTIASNSELAEVEGIGQIGIPKTPSLAKMTIRSMFWTTNPDMLTLPASAYVDWLEKWQASKKPATMVITRLNYSMRVTCESFRHWINAGEEKDVYFELQLQEYRSFGARKLNTVKNSKVMDFVQTLKGLPVTPLLVEIPRPARGNNRGKLSNPYVVLKGDTVLSITKKVTGNDKEWKKLYEENKRLLGDLIKEGDIPVGTELTLPNSWIRNDRYNVVSG